MEYRKLYYKIKGKLLWTTVYGELDKPIKMIPKLREKGVRSLVLVNATKAAEV